MIGTAYALVLGATELFYSIATIRWIHIDHDKCMALTIRRSCLSELEALFGHGRESSAPDTVCSLPFTGASEKSESKAILHL